MAGTLTTTKGAPIQKIGTLPKDLYDQVVKEADITLIEADGSRGMPAKIPADYEPVIPENVDEIHIVIGMSALGKTAKEVVHRLCLADDDLEIKEDTTITPLHLQKLLKKGYLEPLREQHNDTKNQSISRTGRYLISKSDRPILTGRKRCYTDQRRLV